MPQGLDQPHLDAQVRGDGLQHARRFPAADQDPARERLSPFEEVENLIYGHPKVRVVTLVGMPDPVMGERACAFVVPKAGETLVVKHLYIERRMTPLNLYTREMPVAAAREAIVDYGQAVKDLASTNIFPGDMLLKNFGVVFNQLYVLTNMPIQRFGSMLVSKGQFSDYISLLKESYSDANLGNVMCRNLVSVDWQGYLYDCDFNQQLGLALPGNGRPHLRDLLHSDLRGNAVRVADHCYGCTAGQGSSCAGALHN